MSFTKRLAVPSLVLLLAGVAASAAAGDTAKAARGIVTSIGSGSIAINLANDTDVTFRVEADTCVVARGAGRKMRQAQAQGVSGVKLSEVLPIGSSVQVSYEERDGQRVARRIVSISASAGR